MKDILRNLCHLSLIIFLLSGCGPYYYPSPYSYYPRSYTPPIHKVEYDISLVEVQRPLRAKERYGPQKIEKIIEKGISKYYFEDAMIKIIWLPDVSNFSFIINNKTDYSIRLIWDEAAFVDENGFTHRVTHSGVKYIDRNNPQPPSVIIRKGNLADFIVPTDYIEWKSGYYGEGWDIKSLLPETKKGSIRAVADEFKKYLNKTFQVLLPLQIEGVTNDYIFTFKIDKIKIEGRDITQIERQGVETRGYKKKALLITKKEVVEKIKGKTVGDIETLLGIPDFSSKNSEGKTTSLGYKLQDGSITIFFDDKGVVNDWMTNP